VTATPPGTTFSYVSAATAVLPLGKVSVSMVAAPVACWPHCDDTRFHSPWPWRQVQHSLEEPFTCGHERAGRGVEEVERMPGVGHLVTDARPPDRPEEVAVDRQALPPVAPWSSARATRRLARRSRSRSRVLCR